MTGKNPSAKAQTPMESAKKTPLYDRHAARGAVFGETGGFFLPKNYGDPQREAKTVRESVGIIDISSRGKLVLRGADHLKFLQGMLTNDVKEKTPGAGVYAAILTPKGKMISDMRVFKNEDSVYMDIEPGMGGDIAQLLRRFKLSYKAEVLDVTGDYCVLHACGSGCGELISKRLGINVEQMNEYDHKAFGEATIMKLNRTGETGFDVLFENRRAGEIWNLLLESSPAPGLSGQEALETLRIEAGIPVYGKDMDISTIPIEAGIWDALDFEKGCYVGQEVIARIKWRGRVNWHLAYFAVQQDGCASPGDILWVNEKKVGRITSSAYSPTLGKNIAIGYIRREFRDFQGELTVDGEQCDDKTLTTVKIMEKPFYKRFE